MLGKLIKYDMKALNRFLILIHGFLLLAALLMRFLLTGRIMTDNPQSNVLLMLSMALYILIVTAASLGTMLVIATRFYQNLFSDEGYLTHTLPVTSGQHLASKTITGTLWILLDNLLVFLSMYIVTYTPYISRSIQEHKAEFLDAFGLMKEPSQLSIFRMIVFLFLFLLAGAFSSAVSIFASICLGQLFSGHRILGAIVSYFALSTVVSLISLAFMGVSGLLSDTFVMSTTENNAKINFNVAAYMTDTFRLTLVLSLFIGIALYLLSHYIMKKKINLL